MAESGNPTEFWDSQPGAQEDLQAGRAVASAELYDEAQVRERYEVISGVTEDDESPSSQVESERESVDGDGSSSQPGVPYMGGG